MLWRIFFLDLVAHASGFNVLCYYTNWAQYRPDPWKYFPENIDPNLCTHIIFAYSKPAGINVETLEWNDEDMYQRTVKLKQQNPKIKIILAIGGATVRSEQFLYLAAVHFHRGMFARNVVKFLRERNFDGFEMSWQYPDALRSYHFTKLIQKLREVFNEEAIDTGKVRLVLAVAVGAKMTNIYNRLNIAEVAGSADFLNVMTYDFHEISDPVVGFNSPLYAFTGENGTDRYLNLDWVAKYYVSQGAPKNKLNLAIASYGRSYTLDNPKIHGILSPVYLVGNPGTYTKAEGIMSYYEVCNAIKYGGRVFQVESQGNPYVVKRNQWIGYDDVASVTKKACYVKDNNFGGVMFWTLDYDDFRGTSCGQGRYPLLNAINNVLFTKNKCPSETRTLLKTSDKMPAKNKHNFNVLCYYTNWAQYRPVPWSFVPVNVDPHLCTHISYAFSKPTGMDVAAWEWNDEAMYLRLIKLKNQNPQLKILLAVTGGYPTENIPFVKISIGNFNRNKFAENVVRFLRQRNFDGFEMAWQYPNALQKEMFTELIRKLRDVFEDDARVSERPRLELAVAVPAGKKIIDSGINISEVAKYADLLNVMTLNFHGYWEKIVGFNSPLYAGGKEQGESRFLNLDWVAEYYVSQGAPMKKLNLAVSSFGRSFTLSNPDNHIVFSPSSHVGKQGPFTKEAGLMSFYEVCEFIRSGAKVVNVTPQGNPYAYKGDQWVGYDDVASVTEKASYVRNYGYGGVSFWCLDLDDFIGTCNQGRYPLLKAINAVLLSGKECSSAERNPVSMLNSEPPSFVGEATAGFPFDGSSVRRHESLVSILPNHVDH